MDRDIPMVLDDRRWERCSGLNDRNVCTVAGHVEHRRVDGIWFETETKGEPKQLGGRS